MTQGRTDGGRRFESVGNDERQLSGTWEAIAGQPDRSIHGTDSRPWSTDHVTAGRRKASSNSIQRRSWQLGSRSELRHLQANLVDARDQYAEVVSDDLAQHLVELTDLGLRPKRVTELSRPAWRRAVVFVRAFGSHRSWPLNEGYCQSMR